MAFTLEINNFDDINILAQNQLTDDIVSGVAALPVQNSVAFQNNAVVLLGDQGATTCELLTAQAPANSTTVSTTTNTTLDHNNGDSITQLFGSTLNVYRAADVAGNGTQPPDTNFTPIGSVVINPTQTTTLYIDNSGVSGNWYKYTYYNPNNGDESALSDSGAFQAGAFHYVSLDQVRSAAGFTNSPNVTNQKIAEFRDSAEKELNGALLPVYDFPLPQPTNPIVSQIVRTLRPAN